ncbi:hypothetical protein KUCAC02_036890 [Chaenocephalus aceratus]|nr:hypothetical protein KUCAC02_036890 [Chaenocephalus aceratus]
MKKNGILSILTLCILGMGLLACGEESNSFKKDSSASTTTAKTESSASTTTDGIVTENNGSTTNGSTTDAKDGTDAYYGKKTDAETAAADQAINKAFDKVVKVLHAPYKNGDLFFKIFTGTTETSAKQNGEEIKIGDLYYNGSGTWSFTAGKDDTAGKDNSISYNYLAYQPKGSDLSVNGKMQAMYRSHTNSGLDSIGFNYNAAGKIGHESSKMVDTLKFDGAFNATLQFIYPFGATHTHITKLNYANYLYGADMGLFITLGAKVEFTYAGKTIELNSEQLETLLHVAK